MAITLSLNLSTASFVELASLIDLARSTPGDKNPVVELHGETLVVSISPDQNDSPTPATTPTPSVKNEPVKLSPGETLLKDVVGNVVRKAATDPAARDILDALIQKQRREGSGDNA